MVFLLDLFLYRNLLHNIPSDLAGSELIPKSGVCGFSIILEVRKYVPSPPIEITKDFPSVSFGLKGHSYETVSLPTCSQQTSSNRSQTSK